MTMTPLDDIKLAERWVAKALAQLRGVRLAQGGDCEGPEFGAIVALMDADDALVIARKALKGLDRLIDDEPCEDRHDNRRKVLSCRFDRRQPTGDRRQ